MTLTQTAVLTRQVILTSSILLIVSLLGLIGYNIWHAYYIANLPPVEEKPDVRFGILPETDFPKGSVSTSNYSYSLDTVTGGLPKMDIDTGFEKIIKVYFMTQTFATLLSPEKSISLAEKFGITTLPRYLSETEYQFNDRQKNLLVNLDTGNFSYSNESSPSAKDTADDENRLVNDFKSQLSLLGVLKEDLNNGRSKVINLDSKGSLQISLWPAALDNKNIYTSDFNKSSIYAVVAYSAGNLDNYKTLNFTYFPVDITTYATYYLKTPADAFNDLKTGKGVVLLEPDTPQVSITSVNIGYFLPEKYTPYLQPIYIFEGPGFMGYVRGINDEYVTAATQN